MCGFSFNALLNCADVWRVANLDSDSLKYWKEKTLCFTHLDSQSGSATRSRESVPCRANGVCLCGILQLVT